MENEVSEKEKYYTPSIEEFHVGFEYEIFNFEQGWIKAYLNDDMYLDGISKVLLSMKRCLIAGILFEMPGSIRVKHLDSSDIESFGFEYIITKSLYGVFSLKEGKAYQVFFHGDYPCNNKRYIQIINGLNEVLFAGIIKNKSEFSRLLKQLSII